MDAVGAARSFELKDAAQVQAYAGALKGRRFPRPPPLMKPRTTSGLREAR